MAVGAGAGVFALLFGWAALLSTRVDGRVGWREAGRSRAASRSSCARCGSPWQSLASDAAEGDDGTAVELGEKRLPSPRDARNHRSWVASLSPVQDCPSAQVDKLGDAGSVSCVPSPFPSRRTRSP